MNSLSQKEFIRFLEQTIRGREKFLRSFKKMTNRLHLLSGIYYFLSFIALVIGFYDLIKIKRISNDNLYLFFGGIAFIFVAKFFNSMTYFPPRTKVKKNLDNWALKNGIKRLNILFISYLFLALVQLVPSEIFQNNYRVFVASGFSIYLIAIIIVYIILWKPYLFVSHGLTYFGSGLLVLALSTYPARVLTLFNPNPAVFWGASFIITILLMYIINNFIFKNNSLNIVQLAVLYIIPPERILTGLSQHNNILENQYNAILTQKKLEKELSPEVWREFIKLIITQYGPQKKPFYWILGVLVGFIVESVSEVLFQDLIYESIIRPAICIWLNVLCN